MAADGSVVIEADMNVSSADKELSRLKAKIEKLEKSISDTEAKRSPLAEQMAQYSAELDRANEKLHTLEAEKRRIENVTSIENTTATPEQIIDAITAQQQVNSELAEQQKIVDSIQKKFDSTAAKVEQYDAKLASARENLNAQKADAGELAERIASAQSSVNPFAPALEKAEKSMDRFVNRVKRLAYRVFVFTLITAALRSMRTWLGNVVKSNDEARKAMARLKGSMLTLVQPLVEVIIPAFTAFVNILERIVSFAAGIVSSLFGTTADESAKSAENLYEEQKAIEGVGDSAKQASKQLASFDEINKLSADDSTGGGASEKEITPDFSGAGDMSWLEDTLGDAAGWVTAALLIGGIALIAIGACMGSLSLVVAGLLLIGSGVVVGTETGVLDDWAEVLGLSGAEEFVTSALLIAGIALIAIGAMTLNLLAILAGLILLGAGVAVGVQSGTFASWAEALQLETVFDYVAVALQLAGIAFIAIGAVMANIAMVIVGAILLGSGVAMDAVGEKQLSAWWEVLQLTTVQQWVSVALLLVGIVLVAIGAVMANIFMVLGGAALIGFGSTIGVQNNNLADWVAVLGLEKVAGWVTAALLLAGIGLIVFGIATANILMVGAGLALLGAGVVIGTTSGTFSSWIDTIISGLKEGWENIKTWFSENVGEWFTLEKWAEIGRSMLDGLFNGLANIGSKISEWGSGFINGVKDFFGIHSPSTEFESLGDYMMQGLQGGVDDNSEMVVSAFQIMFTAILGLCTDNVSLMQAAFVAFMLYMSTEFANQWDTLWTDFYQRSRSNIEGVISEIKALNAQLAAIERNITITITTIRQEVSGGSSGGGSSGGRSTRSISLPPLRLGNIPALAQGAVIPPNRAFMAVLGDQKQGTNIEAPLETIVQAFRTAMQDFMGNGQSEAVMEVDREAFGRLVYRLGNRESSRIGVNLVEGRRV